MCPDAAPASPETARHRSFRWPSPSPRMPFSSHPLPLVGDDPAIEAAVRLSLPDPNALTPFPLQGVTNEQNTLSAHGQRVVEATQAAGLLLAAWQLDAAPVLNTLSYHTRRVLAGPVVALCRTPTDAAASLLAGADAFAFFPLDLPLLQARAVAYRRLATAAAAHAPTEPAARDVLHRPPFRLDRTAHRAFVGDHEVELTPREFDLLDFLLAHAGALCTRDQILNGVWGIEFDTGTNMVDVYMHFLRKKLDAFGARDAIQTIRGRGYRLTVPDANEGAPLSG